MGGVAGWAAHLRWASAHVSTCQPLSECELSNDLFLLVIFFHILYVFDIYIRKKICVYIYIYANMSRSAYDIYSVRPTPRMTFIIPGGSGV